MLDSLVRVSRRVGDRHFVKHRARIYTSVGATARNGRRERGLRRDPLRPHEFLRLPTDADSNIGSHRFPFSNFKSFSLSFQSSLHLSLAVLVRYRSLADI